MYKSYYQIEVAKEDRHKTALLTTFGSYAIKYANGLNVGRKHLPAIYEQGFENARFDIRLHR